MSSDLEKFIQRNRDDFDQAKPPENTWEKILANFPTANETKSFRLQLLLRWTVAAATVIAILTSVYFLVNKKYSHDDITENTTKPEESSSITPEYAVEFNQVYESVTIRQKELEKAATAQPELYQQFQEDLAVLDSSYRLLKNQVMQSVNRDLITRAMIQNLQLQAELLSRQLQIMNQLKNTKKQSHETSI